MRGTLLWWRLLSADCWHPLGVANGCVCHLLHEKVEKASRILRQKMIELGLFDDHRGPIIVSLENPSLQMSHEGEDKDLKKC